MAVYHRRSLGQCSSYLLRRSTVDSEVSSPFVSVPSSMDSYSQESIRVFSEVNREETCYIDWGADVYKYATFKVTGQLPLGQLPLGQLPLGQLPWGQLPREQLLCRTITPIGQLPREQLPPGQLPPRTITPVGPLPRGQLPLLVGQLSLRTTTHK